MFLHSLLCAAYYKCLILLTLKPFYMSEDIYLPIVTLSNGLRVANFNSNHPFNFEDGSVLEGCLTEITQATMLDNEDVETFNGIFINVKTKFVMSNGCIDRLMYVLKFKDWYDVCLVPLPVLQAIKTLDWVDKSKFRGIYVTDRITKAISIIKFRE